MHKEVRDRDNLMKITTAYPCSPERAVDEGVGEAYYLRGKPPNKCAHATVLQLAAEVPRRTHLHWFTLVESLAKELLR